MYWTHRKAPTACLLQAAGAAYYIKVIYDKKKRLITFVMSLGADERT